MTRTNKYRKFRKDIKKMIQTFADAYACPLGHNAISGYKAMRSKWWKLSYKWQNYVENMADKINEPYFTPDETGMSGWDYDQLFL